MGIGGMSDEVIPEFDLPPGSSSYHKTAADYCHDNGHSGNPCHLCGDKQAVRNCDACQQAYVISHLGDTGICRACEFTENGLRNMIADEVRLIMEDYQNAVLDKIRQSLTLKTHRDNPQP